MTRPDSYYEGQVNLPDGPASVTSLAGTEAIPIVKDGQVEKILASDLVQAVVDAVPAPTQDFNFDGIVRDSTGWTLLSFPNTTVPTGSNPKYLTFTVVQDPHGLVSGVTGGANPTVIWAKTALVTISFRGHFQTTDPGTCFAHLFGYNGYESFGGQWSQPGPSASNWDVAIGGIMAMLYPTMTTTVGCHQNTGFNVTMSPTVSLGGGNLGIIVQPLAIDT